MNNFIKLFCHGYSYNYFYQYVLVDLSKMQQGPRVNLKLALIKMREKWKQLLNILLETRNLKPSLMTLCANTKTQILTNFFFIPLWNIFKGREFLFLCKWIRFLEFWFCNVNLSCHCNGCDSRFSEIEYLPIDKSFGFICVIDFTHNYLAAPSSSY